MKKNNLGILGGAALAVGFLALVSQPVKAGAIGLTSGDSYSFTDNFSGTNPAETVTTVDSYFSAVGGTNVDVLGNVTPVPPSLTIYEGICAAADATADCIDLDGTGGTPQATLQATVDITTAGTVVLSSDLLGASGYLSSVGRSITTSTTIVFGNSACIASPSAINCLYYNDLSSMTANGVYDETSTALTVGVGTYYVEYISNTSGQIGSLLGEVGLVETPNPTTPEPATLVLMGSVLIGLGGLRRFRARR